MNANIGFALSAAVLSLVIVIGAALKGQWWVSGVYLLLVAGFIARAAFGRRARRESAERQLPAPDAEPEHDPERKLRGARFKRR